MTGGSYNAEIGGIALRALAERNGMNIKAFNEICWWREVRGREK